ncbi:type II toxin-antitoxin system VapB family antitoxin [Mesorhizobium xinjiangense]|uniref:type II toxin-antitoxin system VapB family antitoxin n=1 Tax=Mesorhizobium xinjiangense TaxID=2678685 RepID=UPI0012EDCEC0|nr:type II toxin-antitoxin system VapB family antitoxin [Mesorhizobium xinjiangense]
MAITIRNQRVENTIREIGRHTGEGPSAVIARAVEHLRGRTFSKQESLEKLERLMQDVPPRDAKLTWRDLQDEMDNIF